MANTVKVFVVECGECKNKYVWPASDTFNTCNECSSGLVLKTISDSELKVAKQELAGKNIVYSNYAVHILSVQDVEMIQKCKFEAKLKARKAAAADGKWSKKAPIKIKVRKY